MKLHKALSKLNRIHHILFFVLILSFFLRVSGLGYSTFYGDETKTFYLDKTVSAPQFFLDQRKGPVQYGVAWVMEKVYGGYNELWTRVPFAFAGCVSVLTFYLIVQILFKDRVALLATTLFSFNGFYIAFSRTIQYQSFLILFGLSAVYFALRYYEETRWARIHYLVLSGIFLGLSYLSHYDAVFFNAVIAFIFVKRLIEDKSEWKKILRYFVIPVITLVGIFYLPYLINGFMAENTFSYLGRRLSGYRYKPSASWYTFWVYNPHLVWVVLAAFITPIFYKKSSWKENMIHFWFIVPFITFEFIFTNPGTHIHNYVLPALILIALGIDDLYTFISKKFSKQLVTAVIVYAFSAIFVTSMFVFVPKINNGYPWKNSKIGMRNVSMIDNRFHLFLYGFPYERGWKEIADYTFKNDIEMIYTDDNDTIAHYYLHGLPYAIPGSNYIPEYYLAIKDNQEFITTSDVFNDEEMNSYKLLKEFSVEGNVTATLYKRMYDPYFERKKTP